MHRNKILNFFKHYRVRYPEEAAVVEGIRLLMSREKLREEIQKGVKQLDDGQWFDEETVFAELSAEINKIESSQQGS